MLNPIRIVISDFPRTYTGRIRNFIYIKTGKLITRILLYTKMSEGLKTWSNAKTFLNIFGRINKNINLEQHGACYLGMSGKIDSLVGLKWTMFPLAKYLAKTRSIIKDQTESSPFITYFASCNSNVSFKSTSHPNLLSYFKIMDHNDMTLNSMNNLTQKEICYGFIGVQYLKMSENSNKSLMLLNDLTQKTICCSTKEAEN